MPSVPSIPLSVVTSTGALGLATSLDDLTAQAQAEESASVSVPQFAYTANLDERTWRAIDRFEQRVVREQSRGDDPDQLYFGPNTSSLWFKSLFQRDVGELGADAIVTSGVMVWGRGQKMPQAQQRVEGWLRSIAARAKIAFNLQRPDPELWWTPVWARAVKDPQATPRMLAAILQQVRFDQAATPAYQGDLVRIWLERFILDYHDSARAFDVHQEIQALLNGPPIALEGRTRSRDAEATVFLGREAQRHHWDLVNRKLVEVFPDALAEEDLSNCVARVAAFRSALNLRFAPHRILPRLGTLAEAPWAVVATHLARIGHEFIDQVGLQLAQPGRRRAVLMPAVNPNKEVFHWATCGFALTLLGDARAAECFQKVDDLLPAAAGLNAEDRRRVSELRHGTASLQFSGKPAEIVAEARDGAWDEALAMLSNLMDPDERLSALAGLARLYKEQSFRLAVSVGRDVTIGQKSGNDLVLEETSISRKHAKFRLTPGLDGRLELVFQDLGSTNGTAFAETGARLDPHQDYVLPPGESLRLAGKITLYNALENARAGDEIVLKRGLEEGEWILQNKPQEAPAAAADPLAGLEWYQRLPKRKRDTIPEFLWDDIPDPKKFEGIVMTPRFRRILNETAGMVMNPNRMAVAFGGPPGGGKTTIPEMIAAQMGVPYYRYVFSPRTDPSDVEGMWDFEMVPVLDDEDRPVMEDDGVTPKTEYVRVYREGVATKALEYGGHLVWDEPDLGRPGLLAFLNDISNPGPYVWVKKTDGMLVRIKVDPGFRCYVTENGRVAHGKDFLRRFVPYHVGAWSEEEIVQVLTERFETMGAKRRWSPTTTQVLAKIHDRLSFLASTFEDPITKAPMIPLGGNIQQNVEFTPRSVLRMAERLIRSGPLTPETLSRAIRSEYILPLGDPNDRVMVWQQIQPILQPLIQEMGWAANSVGPQAIPVPTLESIEKRYLGGKKVPRDGFVYTPWALRVIDESLWDRSLGIDVMWLGGADIGKTRTPLQISKILDVIHLTGKMSEDTEERDLIGMPGPRGFMPGLVTIAVEKAAEPGVKGVTCHYDEALLLQPGRAESVFGPLMDGDQALLVKTPPRTLKRVPGKTWFLFTSNPYWGEFAGMGRYAQSPAIMSRMAVICMTGEFEMTEQDRMGIRMHEPPPPEVRVRLPGKKKVLSPGPEAAVSLEAVSLMADAAKPSKREHPWVEVHVDFRRDYGLPTSLGIDMKKMEVLEPDGHGGFQPASAATREALDRLGLYLKQRTQFEMAPVVKRIIDMSFRFFGHHAANLANKRAVFNVIDLMRFSLLGALGVGKHEWAHQLLDELHPKYFATEPGRLLFNVMADPRMQEFVAWLANGLFKPQVEAYNDAQIPVLWTEEEKTQWLAARLPHEQFAYAALYLWRTGTIMPWIEDPMVREALEEARPYLETAAKALPQSLEEDDITKARDLFVAQVDQVWPIYERLIAEGKKKVRERLEKGELPEDLVREPLSDIPEGLGQRIQEAGGDSGKLVEIIIDGRAEGLADQFEPNDPEKFAERKEGIQRIKDGTGDTPEPRPPAPPPPPPAPVRPAPGYRDQVDVGTFDLDRSRIDNDLYRRLLAKIPKVAGLLARLKKTLPPALPTQLFGYFRNGKRYDPMRMFQNDIGKVPDPREMLQYGPPEDVEANIVVATDVSGSMVMSGADENAMVASAASIYFSEGLNLRYGELVFGSRVESVKPLGRRLGTDLLKNEMLNKKKQAFSRGLGWGTDIRSGLAKAIEWIRKKRSKADFIILITDGGENVTSYKKTLSELEAECEKEGIELMILAMGEAHAFIPLHFKPEHYRLIDSDGHDIPEIMIEMFEKAHRKRLPRR